MPTITHAIYAMAIGLACALTSCERKVACMDYRPVNIGGWDTADTLTFSIDSLKRGDRYGLSIGLRTSAANAYPFQSVWIEVRQQWERPATTRTDTVECRLTDPEGDALVRNGVSLHQYKFRLHSLNLPQGTRGRVTVRHIMRRPVVTGISDVGIELAPERP